MSDTLYIGDIPSEYHFAQYGSYYIDLYNTDVLDHNNDYIYYRIYLYDNTFQYEQLTRLSSSISVNQYNNNINVSSEWYYRRDLDSIFIVACIFTLLLLFITNCFTSIFKKGGVFSV